MLLETWPVPALAVTVVDILRCDFDSSVLEVKCRVMRAARFILLLGYVQSCALV